MKMKVNLMILGLLLMSTMITRAQSTWLVQNSGTTSDLNATDFYNEDYGLAVGNEGTILRTIDGGLNWITVTSPVPNDLYGVSIIDSTEIMICGSSGLLMKSTDAGLSWSLRTVASVSADLLSVDLEPGGHGIACGKNQAILWSQDGGESWSVLRDDYIGTFYSAQLLDAQTAFVYGENSIMNHLIGRITQPGGVMEFTYFYINYNNILTEGKVRDGYYFNMDSCVTVGAIFPGTAAITCNQPWGVDEWFPVWIQDGSTLNGLDFQDSYGLAVGGAYDGSGSLILESWDKGASWTELTDNSDKDSQNLQVKIIGSTAYVVGQGGKILKKMQATGTGELKGNDTRVSVCPNPATDMARFRIQPGMENTVKLKVSDLKGNTILEKEFSCHGEAIRYDLDVSGYAPGCYTYQLISKGYSSYGKLIIACHP